MSPLAWFKGLDLSAKLIFAGALVLFVIAVCTGLYLVGRGDGKSGERVKQVEVERKAVEKARNADEAGRTTVEREKALSGEKSDRAREAARNSPDPLRDGLRELNR